MAGEQRPGGTPRATHPLRWLSQGCEDGCTLIPKNCFTVKAELLPFPLGIRIDYILYKVMGDPWPPALGGSSGEASL